jgi:hypothetical protein
LRAEDRRRGRAPKLPPHRAHQETDLAHDRDRMPGLEALRLGVEDRVLQRPAPERDEGVDAAGVGFEHRLGVSAKDAEVAPRGASGIDLPRQNVCWQRAGAKPLGIAAGAAPKQRFHLPEPVLRMDEAERGKTVGDRARLDVGDAVGIAPDIDVRGEPVDR